MNIKEGNFVRTKQGQFGLIKKIILKGQGVRYAGETLNDEIIIINTTKIKNLRITEADVEVTGNNPIKLLQPGDFINAKKIHEIIEGVDQILILFIDSTYIYLSKENFGEKIIDTVITKENYMRILIDWERLTLLENK